MLLNQLWRNSSLIMCVVGACRHLYQRKTEAEIEYEMSEFLKHAPHRPGGAKFKVILLVLIVLFCKITV